MYFNMVNQYDTIKRPSKQEDFIVKEKERTEAYIHYILSLIHISSRLMDGHFSAEVERFLGRNQIITAPGRKQEKRIVQ